MENRVHFGDGSLGRSQQGPGGVLAGERTAVTCEWSFVNIAPADGDAGADVGEVVC